MSTPYATKTREYSKLDLELYLNMMQKRIDHYKAEDLINPSDWNKGQIKKLDQMVVEALDKFHNS